MSKLAFVTLCECGCGQLAPIAAQTVTKKGVVKGQPLRFVSGHSNRGLKRSAATRARMSAAQKGKKLGSENQRWKGGKRTRRGRLEIRVGNTHPMAPSSGYVPEYRLIMAAVLGRDLETREQVHHIDLDETNNATENLCVLTRPQHMRVHRLISARGMEPREALKLVLEGSAR